MIKLPVANQEQFIPVAFDLCGIFQPAVRFRFQRNGYHLVGNVREGTFGGTFHRHIVADNPVTFIYIDYPDEQE